jgi:RNA polymerase sigma-70 factor (ECF subfamily)
MHNRPPESEERADETAARDLAWMARVKRGDQEALAELIQAHQQRVVSTVAKMLGSETEAEDVAQLVFIRVWKSAPRYEPTAKFTTWLYKITRNLVLNKLRRRNRHSTLSLQSVSGEDDRPQEIADRRSTSPDASLLEEELQKAIESAIGALPEVQRMALILRRYDELSYEEIADVLELTVPAVKSLLFRARAELREKLRGYLSD